MRCLPRRVPRLSLVTPALLIAAGGGTCTSLGLACAARAPSRRGPKDRPQNTPLLTKNAAHKKTLLTKNAAPGARRESDDAPASRRGLIKKQAPSPERAGPYLCALRNVLAPGRSYAADWLPDVALARSDSDQMSLRFIPRDKGLCISRIIVSCEGDFRTGFFGGRRLALVSFLPVRRPCGLNRLVSGPPRADPWLGHRKPNPSAPAHQNKQR